MTDSIPPNEREFEPKFALLMLRRSLAHAQVIEHDATVAADLHLLRAPENALALSRNPQQCRIMMQDVSSRNGSWYRNFDRLPGVDEACLNGDNVMPLVIARHHQSHTEGSVALSNPLPHEIHQKYTITEKERKKKKRKSAN